MFCLFVCFWLNSSIGAELFHLHCSMHIRLIRSSYRTVLKKCASLSHYYPNPHDFFFAIFGVLVRPSDFTAGGYGNTPYRVTRACFDRPSQPGVAGDTLDARINACMSMVRRLNEILQTAEEKQFLLGQLPYRHQLLFTSGIDSKGNATVKITEQNAPYGPTGGSSSSSMEGETTHAELLPRAFTSSTEHINDSTHSALSSVGPSISTPSSVKDGGGCATNLALKREEEEKNAVISPPVRLFDIPMLCRGTFLMKGKENARSQKFYRHAVVNNNANTFPPYPLLLPPEPMYTRSARQCFSFPLLYDILYCLCASFEKSITAADHTMSSVTTPYLFPSSSSAVLPDSSAASRASLVSPSVSSASTVEEHELIPKMEHCPEEENSEDEESILRILSEEEDEEWEETERGAMENDAKAAEEGLNHEKQKDTLLASPLLTSQPPSPSRATVRSALSSMTIIPASSLTLTDFVEVEVTTRFIVTTKANLLKDTAGHDWRSRDVLEKSVPPFSRSYARLRTSDTGSDDLNFSTLVTDSSMVGKGPGSCCSSTVNVFGYSFTIRNLGGAINPKSWHIQLLSHHLAIMDLANERHNVMEISRPGIGGNFLTLRPGESHFYEGGTSIVGAEGILRGTIQVNAYSKEGTTRAFDLHITPTRLSVKDSWYDYLPTSSAVVSASSSLVSSATVIGPLSARGKKMSSTSGSSGKVKTNKKPSSHQG